MSISLTVIAGDSQTETRLKRELEDAARSLNIDAEGHLVFIDSQVRDLDGALANLDRRGKAVFLIARDEETIPRAFAEGKVDDVLVYPFRPLEVLSKLQRYRQILMWDEVTRLNASFAQIIDQLRTDLQVVEKLQKSRLPARFPDVKGFKIGHRYLAGLRSGGDHFDLAEAQDGSVLSLVLSDSSSYGLSSAVLSVLMRVATKVSAAQMRSAADTVRQIQTEIQNVLGPKDKLSLFFGVIGRKDYRLRFLNLGTSRAFYRDPGKTFVELPSQGESLLAGSGPLTAGESELVFQPGGRLILASDGFTDACGGIAETRALLDQHRDTESADVLNELVYKVKSKFEEPDDLPAQDCTAAVFDLDPRVIRLA